MSWWVDFFKDADSRDISRSAKWFAEDMTMRFGNRRPVSGKQAVIEALGHFQEMLDLLHHDLGTAVVSGDETFIESQVTYVFKDGRRISAPAATYLRRKDGLVQVMHIYVDMTPHAEA